MLRSARAMVHHSCQSESPPLRVYLYKTDIDRHRQTYRHRTCVRKPDARVTETGRSCNGNRTPPSGNRTPRDYAEPLSLPFFVYQRCVTAGAPFPTCSTLTTPAFASWSNPRALAGRVIPYCLHKSFVSLTRLLLAPWIRCSRISRTASAGAWAHFASSIPRWCGIWAQVDLESRASPLPSLSRLGARAGVLDLDVPPQRWAVYIFRHAVAPRGKALMSCNTDMIAAHIF